MVHWIYILRCSGEKVGFTRKYTNDKVYIGETTRLYRRLKEHVLSENGGSCTTSEFCPNRLVGLYKIEDDLLYITPTEKKNEIYCKMYEEGYLDKLENKTDALWLENTIVEMYMQSMGPKWTNVFGGKYHNGYRPNNNPSILKKFDRPYCNCKIPADIKAWQGKVYWRCPVKNIWNELQEYIVEELGLNLQNLVVPCNFYKKYNPEEKFECENFIYTTNNIKLTGKCLMLDDSDDE